MSTGLGTAVSEGRWALLVYAIAGSLAVEPRRIGVRHLCFRLAQSESSEALEGWLCASLQRLGHKVRRGAPQSFTEDGRSAEMFKELLLAKMRGRDQDDKAAGRDSVVHAWREMEFLDARVKHGETGASGTLRTRHYPDLQQMVRAVDLALVAECGGFAPGATVRFGQPVLNGEANSEFPEAGSGRGIVERPMWRLDHGLKECCSSPPEKYYVKALQCGGGLPLDEVPILVPAEHVSADNSPW